jgi:hypothetical protein
MMMDQTTREEPDMGKPLEFEFEPDDPDKPGQMNLRLIATPRERSDYIDRCLAAVGYSVYLFGYHLYCDGIATPVFLPESFVDFSVTDAASVNDTVYPDHAAALAALPPLCPAPGSQVPYAYFRGAGGAVVAPTVFAPATTPRTIDTILTARQMLSDMVQHELATLAISLAGGLVVQRVLTRIVRASETGFSRRPRTPDTEPGPGGGVFRGGGRRPW